MNLFWKKTHAHPPRFVRRWVVALLIIILLSGNIAFSTPQAHAQIGGSVVKDPFNLIVNSLGAASEKSLAIKEWTVDGIFNGLAKVAVQLMLKETIRWINSGFEGSPAFVQDLDGFLAKSADRVAGEIIYGSELNALCRPFALDVRILLSLKARREAPVRCTLSQAVGNVDNFFNNMASGGLSGWFAMTTNPNNNFFGASAAAQSHLFGRQQIGERNNLQEFLANNGFLAKKECEKVPDADTEGNEFLREECKIVLPGNTIAEALNFKLTIPDNTLIAADEVNEVLSALFQQLALKAFTGAGGLLGLTRTGGEYGTTSYIDRVGNPAYDTLPGQNAIGNNFISRAIRDEAEYREIYATPVATADSIVARIAALQAQDAADEDFECSDMSGFRSRALTIRSQLLPKLQASDANLAILRALEARYQTAFAAAGFSTTAQEERLRVVEEFTNLTESDRLHDQIDILEERPQVAPLAGELGQIAQSVENSCRRIERDADGDGGDGDE